MNDFRIALRGLLRAPGFTLAALATLTLAVGAATAVFSIARAVLLEPLPYRDPERIVRFLGSKVGDTEGRHHPVSYPDYLDAVAQSNAFERAAAYDEWSPSLVGAGEPEVLVGAAVESGFFDVLGIRPLHGRLFQRHEDTPGNDTTAILSYSLWRRKFGADPSIVGQPIRLDAGTLTVIGVLGPDFEHPYLGDNTAPVEIWTTLAIDLATNQVTRSGRSFTAIARLRPGVTAEQAAARVAAIGKRLEKTYPDSNSGRGMRVVPLHARITETVRQPIWLLFAAVLLLLAMACVNVANLMLARVSSRNAELAVRSALGARPWNLFLPLLAETLLLGLSGAVLGAFFAHAAIRWISRAAAGAIPRVAGASIDPAVAAFALGAGLFAALLVAAIPAMRQWRGWQAIHLRGRGASEDGAALGAHASLVVVQVALSMVLLAGAALVARSFWNLMSVDTGIDYRGAFVFGVRAPSSAYRTVEEVPRFYDELERRLLEVPGVTAAGATTILPFDGDFNGMRIAIEGRPAPPPGEELQIEQRTVTPGYFEAVGIPILAGRGFTSDDDRDAPRVVIVDETFARRHWPEGSAVGQRVMAMDDQSHLIVGVARAARIMGIDEPAAQTFYVPWKQSPRRRSATMVVRTDADAAAIVPAIRAVVSSISPDAPVMNPRPLADVVGASLGAQKLRTTLLSLFGVSALLLAAVGLAGVLATNVARRRREIGVRMALGATEQEIAAFIVGRGMRMVAAGLVAGALLSLLTNRVLQTMLFGIGAYDPVSLLGVATLLAVTGLLAASIPAWRAATTDPALVLGSE
ncbi:MAG TPA: ABC transporter permease [Thermoanaerobaculia bacterium]|jgi:predicted permease